MRYNNMEDFFNRSPASLTSNSLYPPYNTIKVSTDEILLEIALAGFKKNDISVSADNSYLTVKSEKPASKAEYLYKGISSKSFNRKFYLGDFNKIGDITFEDGLLRISLGKNNPEIKFFPLT